MILYTENRIMTAETIQKPTPAEIRQEMVDFILSLGYTHSEETAPGIPNPLVTTRETGPKHVTYDTYAFPSRHQDKEAVVITNSENDVVIVNYKVGNADSVLSQYFEVNNIHDRQHTKDFLVKHSR